MKLSISSWSCLSRVGELELGAMECGSFQRWHYFIFFMVGLGSRIHCLQILKCAGDKAVYCWIIWIITIISLFCVFGSCIWFFFSINKSIFICILSADESYRCCVWHALPLSDCSSRCWIPTYICMESVCGQHHLRSLYSRLPLLSQKLVLQSPPYPTTPLYVHTHTYTWHIKYMLMGLTHVNEDYNRSHYNHLKHVISV